MHTHVKDWLLLGLISISKMLVRPDRNTSVPPVLIQAGGDDWRTVDLLPQVLVAAVRPWVTISQKSISPAFTSQGCLGKACTSSAQHVAETITFLPDLLSGNLESAASTLSWAGPETGRTTDLSTGHARVSTRWPFDVRGPETPPSGGAKRLHFSTYWYLWLGSINISST